MTQHSEVGVEVNIFCVIGTYTRDPVAMGMENVTFNLGCNSNQPKMLLEHDGNFTRIMILSNLHISQIETMQT